MREKTGILHFYSNQQRNRSTTIIGDEEGFYRLWKAVEEAMVSRAGRGRAQVGLSDGTGYEIDLIRVEGKANFLKRFKPHGVG